MPAAFVKSTTGVATATSAVTDAFATTSGRFIAVVVSCTGGSVTVNSITDTAGNTYTKVLTKTVTVFGSPVATVDIWYAKNITGHVSNAITVNINTSRNIAIAAAEYSGVDTVDPLDKSVSGVGSNASPNSGSTATTTEANELVIGGVSALSTSTNTLSLGTGYADLVTAWTTDCRVGQESKVVTATGAYSATFGLSANAYWACGCATFKESLAAPAGQLAGFFPFLGAA